MASGEPEITAAPRARLTTGPVRRHLVAMSVPMAWGILAVISFNVADTYFVGQLGTRPLAALSFTFPVVMTVMSLALGLGIGVASVLSRALGSSDHEEVCRLTTDSLVLSTLIVLAFVVLGLATIGPLFTALGADAETRVLISDYMTIWYLGMPLLVVPMVGNNAIRACGDARLPSAIMIFAALLNIGLDPLFIFGLGPVPAMGIQGAAVASLAARAVTLLLALAVLHYRMRLIAWTWPRPSHLWDSARRILHVALPAAATNMVNPIAVAVITALVARFGAPAVAGFGVATRIEAFALIPLLALTAGLGPVVGQNWGAGHVDRVDRALRAAAVFCLGYGLMVAAALVLAGPRLAGLFDDHPDTIAATTLYLWLVPVSFTGYGVLICVNAVLNAAGRPLAATALMSLRTFGLYVPLAAVAAWWGSLAGVFGAAALSGFVAGAAAWRRARYLIEA